jgi:hypothetical protein
LQHHTYSIDNTYSFSSSGALLFMPSTTCLKQDFSIDTILDPS